MERKQLAAMPGIGSRSDVGKFAIALPTLATQVRSKSNTKKRAVMPEIVRAHLITPLTPMTDS